MNNIDTGLDRSEMANFKFPENETAENPSLTQEKLKNLSTLELEIHNDFSGVINKVNDELGIDLQSRPEGLHITIIGPTESKVLSELTPEQASSLQQISSDIQNGKGVEVTGLGFIDGSKKENLREADRNKKVLFAALNIPALQDFRKSVGLPEKDFHTTLGFVENDIHMEIAGKDERDKVILKPIGKTANPDFDQYLEGLSNFEFGGLTGQEKQQKQEKPIEEKKVKIYNLDLLSSELDSVVSTGGITVEEKKLILDNVNVDSSVIGKTLQSKMGLVARAMKNAEQQ